MLKIVHRNEDGYKMIGLRWREKPWANGGIEFILKTPTRQDQVRPKGRFVIEFRWGPGAGIVGGYSAFFAFRCKDSRGWPKGNIYRNIPFQIGFTQNANIVPYAY